MLKPHPLAPGDRVAIVAPASPFDRDRFDAGVAEVERLGLVPVVTRDLFARRRYTAGDASSRARALNDAWRDPDIAGIIAARGGYGSAQVLPLLDGARARRARKPFIGHSDLTALLVYLSCHCGLVCFHGPMVLNLSGGADSYDRESLLSAVMSRSGPGALCTTGVETLKPGETTGPLLGGTLTQLAASLGTPHAFRPPPGYVLLLEDVGERPYRLDRMVTQLTASGVLGLASGVVCGEFPGCDEPGGDPTARDVLTGLLADVPGPVLFGFATGHTAGPALTVPLGVRVRIVGGQQARVELLEAAVAT
jgi:muramoyltetrapeptide carboxypeptidase